ncbi:MAG TPA: hypothetical protein PKN32_05675 [Bacteroidales bacterium]|nr:hypothetical protein [Bacteroidales bacterium]
MESEILAVVIFTLKNDETANTHYYKRNVPAKYHCRKSGRFDQGLQ